MLLLEKSKQIKYNPSLQPERIILSKQTTSLGRSSEFADVVLDSTLSPLMISRLHAQITRVGERFFIECNSLNGVLVNSIKRKKCELQDGDVVVFGGAGAKTVDGSVVSNSQSELVYIFKRLKVKIMETSEKNSKADYKGTIPGTIVSSVAKMSKGTTGGCCDIDSGVNRTLHRSSMCEDSPGEGTSDGQAVRRQKTSTGIPLDDSDDDFDANNSGYRKLPGTQREPSKSSASFSEDDHDKKDRIVFTRKNKRRTMPFDSDDDREAQDCPSCRSRATFNNLVPVKVLDNMVDKVAVKVLSHDDLEERNIRIQELQDRINGRMEEDAELRAEYGTLHSDKEYCEKCNLAISNRLLRWVVTFPKTSSTACYHFKCFKPPGTISFNKV
ncbi:hypothetical protein QZH41_017142 [Actinostola sp. cb2023]|nr:hypothetical protein QZH41_017142 [Actinostola sp. cb2023]